MEGKALTAAIIVATVALTGCAPLLNPDTGQPVGNSATNTSSVIRPGVVVRSSATKVRTTCGIGCQFSAGLIPFNTTPGQRILVRIIGGPLISVSQKGSNPAFTPGERVEVIHSARGYHVVSGTGKYAAPVRIVPPA
jgi:hypothetical protein